MGTGICSTMLWISSFKFSAEGGCASRPDVIAHVNRLTRNLLVCVMLTSAIQSFWSDYVFSLLWDFLQRFPLFLFLDLISAYIFLYCFLVLNNLDIDILHLRKVQNFLIVSS